MIAPATPAVTDEQIQREFERMLPELSSRIRCRLYRCGPDRQAEGLAEGIAMSWSLYRAARFKGKVVSASSIAWYALKAVFAGRKLAGSTSLDVLSETPLAKRRIGRALSLSDADLDGGARFYKIYGDRRWRWPVWQYVAARLDWDAFVHTCSPWDKQILAMRQEGFRQTEIAAALKISPPAVNQRLRRLRERWEASSAA